jgi:hypothetical protein
LKVADPVLTGEILRLGFDELAAAQWACKPFRELDDSPATLVAAGHRTKILDAIYRTAHGHHPLV